MKRQIILDKTIASATGTQTVSEDSVLEFYDMMKGLLYSKPKGFTFDLIEVSVDKTANELREKIVSDIEKWREIISEDAYSPDILRTTTEPLFFSEYAVSNDKDLAFMVNLEIGEVGPVTEVSSSDYMIVIKRENKDESFTPYDEASSDIRMMLEQQQQRAAYDKFRSDLIARAVVEIRDPSLFPAPASPDIESVLEPEVIEPITTESQDVKEEPATENIEADPALPQDTKEEPAPENIEAATTLPQDTKEEPAPENIEADPALSQDIK
jgi:hypothetical protein